MESTTQLNNSISTFCMTELIHDKTNTNIDKERKKNKLELGQHNGIKIIIRRIKN